MVILSIHSILGWAVVSLKSAHKTAPFSAQRAPISTSIHHIELTCHHRTKWPATGHRQGQEVKAKTLSGSHHASNSVKEFVASKTMSTPAKRHQPLPASNANVPKTISPTKSKAKFYSSSTRGKSMPYSPTSSSREFSAVPKTRMRPYWLPTAFSKLTGMKTASKPESSTKS